VHIFLLELDLRLNYFYQIHIILGFPRLLANLNRYINNILILNLLKDREGYSMKFSELNPKAQNRAVNDYIHGWLETHLRAREIFF
jgi:hypothetical protein